MKRLFFDMDGVLADFESGLARVDETVKKEYEGHYDEIPGLFSLMSPTPKEYLFDPMYLECLILEMIEDGTLKPLRIIRDNSKRPYPIGGFYNRKYLYKGEDMGGWYNFSVVKNEKQM